MPRKAAGLTAAKVQKAGPGRYGDGGGLYLLVRPNGNRFWLFRYVREKRMREMGLGPAGIGPGLVSLAQARAKAGGLMKQVRDGFDPLNQRAADQAEAKAAVQMDAIKAITFKLASARFIAAHEAGWQNGKHHAQWRNTLATYADPQFGDMPVADVSTAHVLAALEPIWTTKPETAGRVRGRIEAVLDYAKARGWRNGENPAAWKGHLAMTLPARSKVAPVEHHAALPWSEIGAFMIKLRDRPGLAARALEFAILTACRTREVLGATWGEVDMHAAVWTIPPARMKAGREHRVPLSGAAMAVLHVAAKLRAHIEPSAPVFPGAEPGKPLSGMAMLMTLRRMGRDDLTAHGFRSTFRDWTAEATTNPAEVAEMAVAHAVGDKVEAAYRRGDLFEKRRRLMDEWAAYCARPVVAGAAVAAICAA
ncbi:tyrosine-type recombinase/integrase [Limobrevibacterium gyesilva]|uniref:Integrase arm-type DNA-binding domain-containing protein n=1 Tax=Limobrevibacterium gyesilva TaxID=2991712 RepID=A0AA41YQ84_9PROT|nr:site-specific integrase [Limobrevibacterium gyesilva]MCW3477684.1 integrase arm-type DNA-binding domain-containing protein [Limobrevibacterium gyesilva]